MPDHQETRSVKGVISEIFAHRFVVDTQDGAVLADLGPKGAERVKLAKGEKVALEGDMKPSELKVARIAIGGAHWVTIDHPHKDGPLDPRARLETVRQAVSERGYEPLGQPRRKPKHFEILGRKGGGDFAEFHVEFDGKVRKIKPVETGDPRWREEMRA